MTGIDRLHGAHGCEFTQSPIADDRASLKGATLNSSKFSPVLRDLEDGQANLLP
jgi:hypothetical protein